MKKNLYDLYKPNNRNTGTAIQISKSTKGINLQLAVQKTVTPTKTFDWKDNSHSATIKIDELSLILSNYKTLINSLLINSINKENKLNEVLDSCKCEFRHFSSTSPKIIEFYFEEFPINSNNIIYKIKISDRNMKSTIEFLFNKDEYESFFLLIENEIKSQFENNMIDSVLVNVSEKDVNGLNGYRTIKSIMLPILNNGEIITNIRPNLKLEIIKKVYDADLCKPIYFVKEIK